MSEYARIFAFLCKGMDRAAQVKKRYLRNTHGGVAVMTAIVFPVMLGFSALATEYGYSLTVQIEHQRVADLAAYAGALAYGRTKSQDAMQANARSIAALHGIAPSEVTINLVTSPRTPGAQAVSVSVQSPQPIHLARFVGGVDLTITSSSLAEIGGGKEGSACIIALDANGTGVTMSGGTTLSAAECSVASNATITVPCGTSIITKSAVYNANTPPAQGTCVGIKKADNTPAPITKGITADPLAQNKGVLASYERLKTVAATTAPPVPGSVTGRDLSFNPWDRTKREALTAALGEQGCTAAYDSIWTVTCDPARNSFTFGNLLIESSLMLEFDLHRDIARYGVPTYNFTSITSQGGGNYRFGAGTFVVSGGIAMGGSEATFGNGTFKIGKGTCGYSICGGNSGTMSFAGPSTFELPYGIVVNGSIDAKLGTGDRNSYRLGPSTVGPAINVQSGSLIMAGAGGSATTFTVKGRIQSGGGSCLALPAVTDHDIAGSIDVQGALELGAGSYMIDGYLGLGQSSGGAAKCNGRTTSLRAENVNIAVSGKETMTGKPCAGTSFCASAGYNDMVLTSPPSGSFAQLAIVGPSGNAAGAALAAGASGGTIAGAFYFPNGPISMSGGSSASGTDSECMTMIGSTITISGGTSAATKCKKLAGASGSDKAVRLVN